MHTVHIIDLTGDTDDLTGDTDDLTGDTDDLTGDDYEQLIGDPQLYTMEELAGFFWTSVDGARVCWVRNNETVEHLSSMFSVEARDVVRLNKHLYSGLTSRARLYEGTILALNNKGKECLQPQVDPREPSWFEQKTHAQKIAKKLRTFTGRGHRLGGHKKRPRGSTEAARAFLKRKTST